MRGRRPGERRRGDPSGIAVSGGGQPVDPAASLDLPGGDGEPELDLQRPGDRPTHRVRLPAGSGGDLGDGGAGLARSIPISAACLVPTRGVRALGAGSGAGAVLDAGVPAHRLGGARGRVFGSRPARARRGPPRWRPA